MKVPVCYRNQESGEIEQIETEYEGALSLKVIRTFNRVFLKQAANGRYYPCDPMDCYQEVWAELCRKAETEKMKNDELRMKNGGIVNHPSSFILHPSCSTDTYLNHCMLRMLMKWQNRKVKPVREQYRQLQKLEAGPVGAKGVDDFDVDNWNPVDDVVGFAFHREPTAVGGTTALPMGANPAVGGTTALPKEWVGGDSQAPRDVVREKGEEIAADLDTPDKFIDYEARARRILGEICEALISNSNSNSNSNLLIIRAFRLYVEYDGNLFAIANTMKIPKSSFYRKWEGWLKTAKKVWENWKRSGTM